MTFTRIAVALMITLMTGACQRAQEINVRAERALVEQAINDCIMWQYPEKDPERLRGCLARDSSFFIFHPDAASTIRGYEAFDNMIQTAFMNDKFKPGGSEISDLNINISESGDAAWFHCIFQDHGEWAGHAYSRKNNRWTGVLEKRDGKWLIVQMHISFPSDAAESDG